MKKEAALSLESQKVIEDFCDRNEIFCNLDIDELSWTFMKGLMMIKIFGYDLVELSREDILQMLNEKFLTD